MKVNSLALFFQRNLSHMVMRDFNRWITIPASIQNSNPLPFGKGNTEGFIFDNLKAYLFGPQVGDDNFLLLVLLNHLTLLLWSYETGYFRYRWTGAGFNNPHAVAVLRPWRTPVIPPHWRSVNLKRSFRHSNWVRSVSRALSSISPATDRSRAITWATGRLLFLIPLWPSPNGKTVRILFLSTCWNPIFSPSGISVRWCSCWKVSASGVIAFWAACTTCAPYRPLLVTGSIVGQNAAEELKKTGLTTSPYEGPTTICSLISRKRLNWAFKRSYHGAYAAVYTVGKRLFGTGQVAGSHRLSVWNSHWRQYPAPRRQQIKTLMPRLTVVVRWRRRHAPGKLLWRQSVTRQKKETPPLSPEIESFLKEMENRFKQE